MKLMIAVIGMLFVMAHSVPVPEPEESIDLIKIPLKGNKVSLKSCPVMSSAYDLFLATISYETLTCGNTNCYE